MQRENSMAKKIMIQGTMSNAGKSLICAGLCRIFAQDGYKVAPFKSQNMALNSYVTEDGLEIGRAQAVQAMAAGQKPSVYMNPILLKPTNDTGSQVIVNGEVFADMSARDYFKYKRKLIPQILDAFYQLEKENDIIVIEGAGSPAEINLKSDDIVNMGVAELVDAKVLLAGDIDRGGVFAQLYGTVELLEKKERDRIKGFIINKFRGDKQLLEPGLKMLKDKCGIDTVGVIPFMNVDIEDEDSLSERFEKINRGGIINVVIIKLPKISNFTDFLALENNPNINISYAGKPSDLEAAHMIIIPGTKNTIGDMKWLHETGLDTAIIRKHSKGCVIFGICGGYQILGKTINDPLGVEQKGLVNGLGLLPIQTVYTNNKIKTNSRGVIGNIDGVFKELSGCKVEGYEIHMGRSTAIENHSVDMIKIANKLMGSERLDGICIDNVYGTYLHGFFDADGIVEIIVKALADKNNLSIDANDNAQSIHEYRNQQFDILADGIRNNIDMNYIYELIN